MVDSSSGLKAVVDRKKRSYQRIIGVGAIVLLAGFIVWSVRSLTGRYPTGPRYSHLDRLEREGLPDFSLPRLDGTVFDSASATGKVIIVNFWASWCDPCVAEYPSMLKLVEEFKGEVVMLAISADAEERDIHDFLKVFGGQRTHVEILRDPEMSVAKQFGTLRLPESFIFDREGRFERKVIGLEDWYTGDSREFFRALTKRGSR